MIWVPLAALATVTETPVGTATTDLVTYITSFGVLGLVALAFFARRIVPASMVKEAREEARADIKAELDRTIAEKHAAEEQRDEALRIAQSQLVPLLIQFTSATQSLLPLLQELVSRREGWHDRDRGDRR